jgi:hypothetical protein
VSIEVAYREIHRLSAGPKRVDLTCISSPNAAFLLALKDLLRRKLDLRFAVAEIPLPRQTAFGRRSKQNKNQLLKKMKSGYWISLRTNPRLPIMPTFLRGSSCPIPFFNSRTWKAP